MAYSLKIHFHTHGILIITCIWDALCGPGLNWLFLKVSWMLANY